MTPDSDRFTPLAERMRPTSMMEYCGQGHLLQPGKPLYEAIYHGFLHSMILWGPPGTGKTTLAELVAQSASAQVTRLSAVLAGVKDIRDMISKAEQLRLLNKRLVVFVDEVHRFNKAQQDVFLPHIESGLITLIGATTENPSFALNNALLSRARVYVLHSLTAEELTEVIEQALARLSLDTPAVITTEGLACLVASSDGDARVCLNFLEQCLDLREPNQQMDAAWVASVVAGQPRRFDQGGDVFFDQISALHKSVRGSDPDAAVYWLQRMLDGGCDPHYLARRLIRIASEDIGNADPRALTLALNAADTYARLGSPEGELSLAQAVIYLACAAKSNAVYVAAKQAQQAVKTSGSLPVPKHLRNAPTRLMDELGHGHGYRYAHDEPDGFAAGVMYLPDDLSAQSYYQPTDRGLEKQIQQKLAYLRQRNAAALRASNEEEVK